jgi:oligopeptide transport system substrate-binding protein
MYSLEITLTQPCASFLNILSTPGCWVYPKEAYAKYPDQLNSHPLGTGPFVAKGIKRGEYVVLARNERYWGRDGYGNVLPYLDGIHFAFVKDKKAEFLKFRNNELDMVFPIPVDLLHELKKEIHDAPAGRPPFNMQLVPALRISYYGFQHALPPFDNVKVRQAFNLAVDKHEIVSFILEGAGTAGEYGIVPPGIKGYDTAGFRAYPFNPVRARALLSEAGYPGGRGFPALLLEVNGSGSDRNSVLAGVVSKMLKDNLNVDVRIDPVATAQDLDELNETAKTHFFYSTWTADYPDPETFLTMLYSKHIPASLNERSPLNTVRYRSSTFDSLFELAAKESASDKRYELYRLADQVATADAAIMPIFYDQIQRLVQTNVRNFKANAMEYRDMTEVWLEK